MSHTLLTILGISFIFLMTTLGASFVFWFKHGITERTNSMFLGFASGIMIAASIWSLLIPAMELSSDLGRLRFLPASIGFIAGGCFLVLLDKIIPHFHQGTHQEEGPRNKLNKATKLFLAITIHNIPEGLSVGFVFGAATSIGSDAAFLSAIGLALGIGIQNIPEGAAVSLPMKSGNRSNLSSFLFGMGSGGVEPIFAIIGYFLASDLKLLQPWLLSFAAGAMIFVVTEDLIPDMKLNNTSHASSWALMIGFVLMMILDVSWG